MQLYLDCTYVSRDVNGFKPINVIKAIFEIDIQREFIEMSLKRNFAMLEEIDEGPPAGRVYEKYLPATP